MKTIIATIAILAVAVGFGDTERQANQSWVLHKIDEVVGTNTAAQIAAAANDTLQAAKDYTDQHGGGGGSMATNAVIDIASATIATNPVVAAKLDGPTVEPTNTAEAAGKAADAKQTGIALANRYTKAEVDLRLAGCLGKAGNDVGTSFSIDSGGFSVLSYNNLGGYWQFGGQSQLAAWLKIQNLMIDAAFDDDGNFTFYRLKDSNHSTAEAIASIPDIERRISESNPSFSNAVLSVATGISTNDWAIIASVADWASVLPGGVPGGAGTLGAVLAALAAAVLALKKKTSLLKSDGTAEDAFAGDLLAKQAAISAMKYGLASTSATVKAADRTVTKVTLGTTAVTVTFPDADENGKTRDFLLRIDAANLATGGSLTITKPTGAIIYGDAFPSPEATKQYLVAITETAANEFYVRTIEITIPTEG